MIPAGTFGLLYGVYLATALLTALLSNASSAAIMVPIVLSLPDDLIAGINVKAFIYCIMVAASADFSTPIGYQTNLMVWGPGGYASELTALDSFCSFINTMTGTSSLTTLEWGCLYNSSSPSYP